MLLKRNDVLPSSSGGQGGQGQGRFKIDSHKLLGHGQFAEVYSAVDLTGGSDGPTKSGRRCAIKIESEMKTTKREATAMRHLAGSGKGILEMYDEGVFLGEKNGKECPFIAMQLVGENLADLKRMSNRRRRRRIIVSPRIILTPRRNEGILICLRKLRLLGLWRKL